MSFKIVGEHTPNHSVKSLCVTCRHAQIVKGQRADESITLCGGGKGMESWRVRMHVSSCTDYDDKSRPPLWEMEKIAWRFSVDRASKRAGFMNPKEFKKRHPDESDD